VLDFGCGKLRYSNLIAAIGERATFVDSEIQLSRLQRIRGRLTTVRDFVTCHYPHGRVVSAESLERHKSKYDLITCINVLSAIPSKSVLEQALNAIGRLTHKSGMAVFVNQHRNSYYTRFEKDSRHLFGHLIKGKHGYSYYGLLPPAQMSALLVGHGFAVSEAWTEGEINFVEARPPRA
jgi:2-polyprenyl-3-methyl-5-hydroxy-6-metoxy-1,4-benzoquinol methylase